MEKDKETVGLKPIIVKYLRNWRLFLLVFVLSFIPAILFLVFYPRTYEVMARIQLQEDEGEGMGGLPLGEAAGLMKSFGLGGGGGSISIDDEVSILSSNRLLRSVALGLGVNVTYSKPYSFYKLYEDSPLKLMADSSTWANLTEEYKFAVSVSPNKIKVKVKSYPGGLRETYDFAVLPATLKIGGDCFILDYGHNGNTPNSFELKIKCSPAGWYAESLAKKIRIDDISNTSNVLELTYYDHSRKRAVDILNMLVQEYNKDVVAYKSFEDSKTIAFINGRLSNVSADLHGIEEEIASYKKANDITLFESDVALYSEEYKDLQQAIIELETNLRLVNMTDEYIKNPANRNSVIPPLMAAANNESGAIAQYNDAVIERERLLQNSNEKNPMFKIIDNEVVKLREGVYVMISNTQKSYSASLNALKAKERNLLAKMKNIPAKEREYVDYSRNREILQGVYLLLVQKREETMLSLNKEMDRARLIDPPFVKKKAVAPRKLHAAIGICIFTLLIPILILLLKDIYVSIKEEYQRPIS